MRYPSVDILRTVALVIMVMVHFPENLAGYNPVYAGLGAPLFIFLSGVSYRLWLNGMEAKQVSQEEISKISIRRGLFVFCVGIAFNVFVWLPSDVFNWDVLTYIGSAILILNQLRHLPVLISILIAFCSALVSPVLRTSADYAAYWTEGYFLAEFTMTDLWVGYLVAGYFPIFPWITVSLAGFIIATLLFPQYGEYRKVWPVTSLGAGLILVSGSALWFGPRASTFVTTHVLTGWTMFPVSTEYLLATIGMAMLLFGLLHQLIDRRPETSRNLEKFHLFKTFGQYAFTVYILHHVAHIWPLWIYGSFYSDDPTIFWQNAMPVWTAHVLGIVFLIVCYLVLRRINPDDRFGVEGWMRWLCG